ncbi:GyrI-like domain-containing protein [Lachnospiraceae bacterium 46-15]
MEYEIVTLEERIAVGVSARTNNASPDMGAVIGGLWNCFYNEGVYASIPRKANEKALGIYTDYAGDEKADYTAMAACETSVEPQGEDYAVCRIPAGKYAKFVVHGDMVQAVAAAWQEIWQMNLPRAFQCDFEEYQDDCMDNAEIHIYVGLKEDKKNMMEVSL